MDLQGEHLSTDDYGRPLDPITRLILPRNNYGQYIYVPPLTQSTRKPLLIVDGAGVELLPNAYGEVRDRHGKLIPTNSDGLLINSDGKLLATDSSGRFVILDAKNEETIYSESGEKVLPTDSGGQIIFSIVDSERNLLEKDGEGRFVDGNGEVIPRDEFGRPLNKNSGKILEINDDGNYVLKEMIKPTTEKIQITAIDAESGKPLPTDSDRNIVTF